MGTSLVENISDTIDEDHPHAYGDKKSPAVLTAPSTGSSPRVWGQGLRVHHRRIQAGIIPTRMGTSPCGRCSCVLLADHPHAYGDKYSIARGEHQQVRSSPRVWGQVTPIVQLSPPIGIIPTRMGTSIILYNLRYYTEDHPHAYGDKSPMTAQRAGGQKSSPRVWGQVKKSCFCIQFYRIIPTRMGTSVKHSVQTC